MELGLTEECLPGKVAPCDQTIVSYTVVREGPANRENTGDGANTPRTHTYELIPAGMSRKESPDETAKEDPVLKNIATETWTHKTTPEGELAMRACLPGWSAKDKQPAAVPAEGNKQTRQANPRLSPL